MCALCVCVQLTVCTYNTYGLRSPNCAKDRVMVRKVGMVRMVGVEKNVRRRTSGLLGFRNYIKLNTGHRGRTHGNRYVQYLYVHTN